MIVTLTPNPALDITYTVPGFRPHASHRVTGVHAQAGGKGVNVSRVLHALGRPTTAVLPLGGRTGEVVRADLDGRRLAHAAVAVGGETRRTVAVVDGTDTTMLNEPGPEVTTGEWASVRAAVRDLLPRASVLTISGSLPAGLREDACAELIRLARTRGVPVILDADGPVLTAGLSARPTVVKPNADELRSATGFEDPERAASALISAGAEAVVASLGPEGLLAVTPDGVWRARPPGRIAGNTAGAGDSVVAALAAGLADGTPWPELLADAVALSAATVLAPRAGEFDPEAYRELAGRVEVIRG
ncbi:1-phosphofructokinase family hexose kinase [Streptomyces sp. NBC_00102]|uniref:1-phosphofructokinase family hexose kinase n=1 Tax=Streptomyces sp. NBC_00102 TaxID=2975652 RepID=UPI002250C356|nr:1-phosphofructokinase family hexose kinase [Streptomyces sp. NBC_00102]MCX5398511.1 1-phosphofructokinase family hexose kinase [Streptomyces sp. NBC_00102]